MANPKGHVTSPMVVGGSIIALRCREGVVMATDNLLTYGGMLKYDGVCRFSEIGPRVLVAATGEYADFQQATAKLKELTEEARLNGSTHIAPDYARYLSSLCYKKRNDQNPFYNHFVVASHNYLATVDLHGSQLVQDYAVAGFARHFGLALIANHWNKDLPLEQCKAIIRSSFEVIFERVCHSGASVQFAVVTTAGLQIEQPEKIIPRWDFKGFTERKNEKLWQ